MPREFRHFLGDIRDAINRIRVYTKEMKLEDFRSDLMTQDAVIRNLEVIGEAARQLLSDERAQSVDIDWPRIIGLRNILTHAYFGVDLDIIWNVVSSKLDDLDHACEKLLASEPDKTE